MSEQAFQIGTQIKLNDNWIMTGEEYEEGVYWPSTGDVGQVREIDEDQLWVEFPNLEGVWPVEFHIADIVKPMAEELAALATVQHTVQCRCGYDACDHPDSGECPGDGLELTASTEAQTFNPYTVNTTRGELLEQLWRLLVDLDILYGIEDGLLNDGYADADSMKAWAELNVLRTALQEGEPAIIEDAFAPTSPTYPTPYAALAFHILNAKVAVLPESTWNNNWTPGQTVNELASEIERLQAALDQERADNVTLRAELQALKSAVRQG